MTKSFTPVPEGQKASSDLTSQPLEQGSGTSGLAPARTLAAWFIRKYMLLALLPMLIQALLFSLPMLMQLIQFQRRNLEGIYGLLYGGEIFFFALSLLFGLILVHKLFSFQHKPRGANLIYALPLTRGQLYLTLLGVLALLLALTRLASLIQNCLLFLPQGINFLYLLKLELAIYLKLWAALALLIFFYIEGANSFNAQLLALLTNIFWPLLWGVLQVLAQACLPSFPGWDWQGPLPLLLAPYFAGLLPSQWQAWTSVMRISLSLVFLLLAYFAFLQRPAEKIAQEDVETAAFLIPRAIISTASAFTMGLLLYYVRYEFTQTAPGWLIVILGLFLGSLLANFLQDLLYSRGIIKFRKALRRALLLTLPALVILALLASGFLGYDYVLPQDQGGTQLILAASEDYQSDYDPWSFPLLGVGYSSALGSSGGFAGWSLDNPDQLSFFIQLLDQAYEEGQPGLALPRSLSSTHRYRSSIQPSQLYSEPTGFSDLIVSWKNPWSPFWHKRILPLADQSLASLDPWLQDPAMACFFYKLAYEKLDKVSLSSQEETPSPGSPDQEPAESRLPLTSLLEMPLSVEDSWLQLWQHYQAYTRAMEEGQFYMPSLLSYSDPFFEGLLVDFQELSYEDRLDLAETSNLVLTLTFRGRLQASWSEGFLNFSRSHIVGQEHKDKLDLPLSEDFRTAKKALVDILRYQQEQLKLELNLP